MALGSYPDVGPKYFRPDEGGVSHFNYLRDNLMLRQNALTPLCRICVALARFAGKEGTGAFLS